MVNLVADNGTTDGVCRLIGGSYVMKLVSPLVLVHRGVALLLISIPSLSQRMLVDERVGVVPVRGE